MIVLYLSCKKPEVYLFIGLRFLNALGKRCTNQPSA